MNAAPLVPIQKHVVLAGAGNAHLRFVRMFGMKPVPGVAVTLVSEAPVIPYSAMVPSHLAGDYGEDDVTIDLVRLCSATGVRLVPAKATAIDAAGRLLLFADRPELRYDVLSLGLGSLPDCPAGLCDGETAWRMRPLGRLIERVAKLEQKLKSAPRPFHFVVVGGGASGCELALSIRRRFGDSRQFRVTLLQGHDRLLPQFPDKAGRVFAERFRLQGIEWRVSARVTGGDAATLELNGGERLAYDTVLWATHAAPPELIRTAGLPLSDGGFLRVRDTLQSVGDPAVFGTGDCISLESHPELLKNGVHAVREGGVLLDNVVRFLHGRPLRRFRPQRWCLNLMNAADGTAILCYGPLVSKSGLARRLKDRIDRAWIDKFTPRPMPVPAEEVESPLTRCGGCGSKISADVLTAVLKRLDVGDDPRLLLGTAAGEDAAVHRMRPELFSADPAKLVEVQTVDYFKAFVDDPYLFGRVAALNAVSDLYAMNARPFTALAIATLPYARGPILESRLFELLSGAVRSLREAGVTLAGGHTTEGADLALGFSVTGYGEEDRLFQKSRLAVGDRLILTKPLGSGALLAAWMRGACRAAWFEKLVQALLQSNAAAGAIFARHGVTACTDVTGFGLAGHLLEMLDASRVSAKLSPKAVPLYEGFAEVVDRGIVSSLHANNAKVAVRVVSLTPPAWLFDPQTSGGLIAGVKPAECDAVLRELADAGCRDAAMIGEVVPVAANEAPAIQL